MMRLAIVGLGAWGKVLVDAVQGRSEQMRFVVAVVRRPEVARADCVARGLAVSTDLAAVLADPDVDGIVLSTPHGQHREQILACAAAGKPVFCEKPLTMTRSDAIECVAACRRAGVVLAVGHERRFEPPLLDLQRRLAAGELGRPMHLEANFSHDILTREPADSWRMKSDDAPTAGLTGPAIHMLDRAVSLFGPVSSLYAQCVTAGSNLPNGDTLSILLRFANGCTGYVGSLIATPFVSRFQLFGSEASVEISDRAWVDKPQGWDVVERRVGVDLSRRFVPPDTSPVRANLESFCAAVRGQSAYAVSDVELVETVACVEAVTESVRLGRPVVPAHLAGTPT